MAVSKRNPFATADQLRIQQIAAAWQAYYGVFPKQLKNRPRKGDDTITTNRCKAIVEKGVSFLFGQDVGIDVDAVAPEGAQGYLDGFWKANRQMSLLQKLALTGGVAGHAIVKLVPRIPYPRLVVIDPSIVTVSHTPGDLEDITEYRLTYEVIRADGTAGYDRELITRQSPIAWVITRQQGNGGQNDWATVDTQVWAHPYPPIVDSQNLPAPSEYWGLSDIGPDLIQLNTDLNFVLSNISRIIRFHASPLTVGKGFALNQLDVSPDGMLVLPSKDAELTILAAPTDLASSLAFAHEISQRMDEISRIPSLALGVMTDIPSGQVSGLALQVLYQPLLEKTEMKRRLYGDLLEDICRRVLDLAGFGSEIDVMVQWPSLLPTDDVQEAKAAQAWLAVGASKDTLLKRGGFDPDLEAQKNGLAPNAAAAPAAVAASGEDDPVEELTNELPISRSVQQAPAMVGAVLHI